MDKKHIIQRQGKDFILYPGLLDAAHAAGLCRVSTVLIQVPHPDNGNTAIVHAEIETSKGTFSGIGDANKDNVGKPIIPHIIRMAETRAKARAMRDAINLGEASAEELGGDDDGGFVDTATGEIVDGKPSTIARADIPKASPYLPASMNQLGMVAKLSRLLGLPAEPTEDMTSAEASERITDLSRQYNERKPSPTSNASTPTPSEPPAGSKPATPYTQPKSNNDGATGGINAGQIRQITAQCKELKLTAPGDLESWSFMQAANYIKDLGDRIKGRAAGTPA